MFSIRGSTISELFEQLKKETENMKIYWIDEENDNISIESVDDLKEAIRHSDRILKIYHGEKKKTGEEEKEDEVQNEDIVIITSSDDSDSDSDDDLMNIHRRRLHCEGHRGRGHHAHHPFRGKHFIGKHKGHGKHHGGREMSGHCDFVGRRGHAFPTFMRGHSGAFRRGSFCAQHRGMSQPFFWSPHHHHRGGAHCF